MDDEGTVKGLVTVEARPERIKFDLSETALLIVDMQNVFAGRGEVLHLPDEKVSEVNRAIGRTKKLAEAARSVKVPVVYLMMTKDPERKGKGIIKGVLGTRIVDELEPRPGDTVIEKCRYSGFRGTVLDEFLRSRGITHVIFAGTATNVCVESTVRDAYFLDYWPILVSDATSNAGPPATQEATLWNVEEAFGSVTTTEDIVRALSGE